MLPRDRHHVLLEVPHSLVIAKRFLAANLLPQQQSLVGGRQAVVDARDVPRFLEGNDRQSVIAGLFVQQGQGAQRLDQRPPAWDRLRPAIRRSARRAVLRGRSCRADSSSGCANTAPDAAAATPMATPIATRCPCSYRHPAVAVSAIYRHGLRTYGRLVAVPTERAILAQRAKGGWT